MDVVPDPAWFASIAGRKPVESLEIRGFRVETFAMKPTAERHQDRYRFRLLAFETGTSSRADRGPVLTVDLESDILGDCVLSARSASARRLLARFDELPDYGTFRALALPEADVLLSGLAAPGKGESSSPAPGAPRI